jgi:MYXO-CTERM domain-containing protein
MFDGAVLEAWNVDTNVTGDVLLSFEVGAGWNDLSVWHFDGAAWTALDPGFSSYTEAGTFCFTASDFSGYAVTSALLRGDCNRDGGVNFSDLGILISNYNQPGGWKQGDFDYDGVVGFSDLGQLIANYNATNSAVPEPASLGLLGLCGLALRRGRR